LVLASGSLEALVVACAADREQHQLARQWLVKAAVLETIGMPAGLETFSTFKVTVAINNWISAAMAAVVGISQSRQHHFAPVVHRRRATAVATAPLLVTVTHSAYHRFLRMVVVALPTRPLDTWWAAAVAVVLLPTAEAHADLLAALRPSSLLAFRCPCRLRTSTMLA